ncbi:alpha-1,2-mannosidase [Streptomyces sp. NPDC047000]|uniref:alpha-1,2-mannosidase n=1 Tax=Streptomyces sp. NPDC047000 TaxID=3155474 RepID=UPI0033EF8A91
MLPVFADFAVRPVELSRAVVRHHRCAVASSYLVVAAGGRVEVDFVVDDGAGTAEVAGAAEAVLRITVLGAAAPMDVVLNGEAVAKGFLLPHDDGPGAVREYVFGVPGETLRAGVNVLEIHHADPDTEGGLLRLRTVALDPAGEDGRARRALAVRANGGVRVFATERRAVDFGVWQPGPPLTFHAGRDDAEEPAARLAWRAADGAESSVAFRTDLSGFHGRFRTAGGATGELRGTLVERRALPDEGTAGTVRHFATEEERDGVWRPAGRLRLLLDDGGAPLERVTWSDHRGTGASVGLRIAAGAPAAAVPADGLRDVTAKVSRVEASDEFEHFGEVAANLLRKGDGKWLAHEDAPELRFVFPDPVVVTAYSLTSANDASDRDPADWHLEGSHDGSSWSLLDSREDDEFERRFETREYTVARPGSFRHYRLRITANRGADMTQLCRVRFFDGGDVPAARPGAYDFTGYQVGEDGEPVGYRGLLVRPAAPGTPEDAEEVLAGDLTDTARSLQEAARLLDRLNRYLGR